MLPCLWEEQLKVFSHLVQKVVYAASFMLTGNRALAQKQSGNAQTPKYTTTLGKKQSRFPGGAALCPENSSKSDLNRFGTRTRGKWMLCSYS